MEIRWSYNRLISTMGFPRLVRQHPKYWIRAPELFLQNCTQLHANGPPWEQAIIGSGNGLVLSGSKMAWYCQTASHYLNQCWQVLRWHMWLGHDELTHCGLSTPYGDIDLKKMHKQWRFCWNTGCCCESGYFPIINDTGQVTGHQQSQLIQI